MECLVQYQKWSPDSQRPLDSPMTEDIVVESVAGIPGIGDHVHFRTGSGGEQGVFRVRSRFFSHYFDPKTHEWRIYANVVVEEVESSSELLKE